MANIQIFNDYINIPTTREMKHQARLAAATQNINIAELLRRALVFYLENLPPPADPETRQPTTREIRHRSTSAEPVQSELAARAAETLKNMGIENEQWGGKRK
jgi:hypothetical protein